MHYTIPIILLFLLCVSDRAHAAVEKLSFEQGGLTLAAEVHLPDDGDDLPGIVLIQGSGASGMKNMWARAFAERFAARGYAVLLPDKRGVGLSGGDWRNAGFYELADDAVASLRALEQHPRVAAGRVGLMGLSQGGHVAPLAARRVENVPFVIDVVGSLVVMEDQLYHELRNAYIEHGLDESTIKGLQEFARLSFDYIREPSTWNAYLDRHRKIAAGPLAIAVATWPQTQDDPYWVLWGKIYDYDPMPYWRALAAARDVPCLVLFGADDEHENVPVKQSLMRAEALRKDPQFTIRVYEGSGHGLFEPGTHKLRRDMIEQTDRWMRAALDDQ